MSQQNESAIEQHAPCYYDTDRNKPLPASASAQAVPVESVGDDPQFRILTRNWREVAATAEGASAWAALVAYIDIRATPASAPSVDRNSVLEEARAACQLMAEGSGRGEYREACNGCANAIQLLKYEAAPQPVAAAQAVVDSDATTRDQYRNMFMAACADLGAINEALNLDPDDGGAEPIINAIEELRAERDKWVDANYVAAAQALPANEAELLAVMDKRDAYHETADLLAYAIAEHLNVGIGEHSSDNCPWRNALAAIAAASPSPAAPKDAQGAMPKLSEAEILESLNTLSHEPPKRLPPGWINFARSIERKVHAKFAQPTDTTKGA